MLQAVGLRDQVVFYDDASTSQPQLHLPHPMLLFLLLGHMKVLCLLDEFTANQVDVARIFKVNLTALQPSPCLQHMYATSISEISSITGGNLWQLMHSCFDLDIFFNG